MVLRWVGVSVGVRCRRLAARLPSVTGPSSIVRIFADFFRYLEQTTSQFPQFVRRSTVFQVELRAYDTRHV
jgi:hypothetical protein